MKKFLGIDLCDSLVTGNTTFLFLDDFFQHNKKYQLIKKVRSNLLTRVIFKVLFKFHIDLNRKIAVSFLKDHSREELLHHAQFMADHSFTYNKELIELINIAKNTDTPIYLISASLDFIVEVVANKLDINFLSTELNYPHSICNGKIKKDLLFSKSIEINSTLKKLQIQKDNLIFISDNIQDLNILKSLNLGYGVYTKKNEKLFTNENIQEFDQIAIQDIKSSLSSI